jgi:glutamate synthase (NADPH/NADH) large chain
VRNINRTVGAMLSGRMAERYGHAGLPDGTIDIHLTGTAGQSFGAFLARGVTLDLVGEANDYVGKGLSGGRIIVRPNAGFRGESRSNIIVGNTVLYGATEGEASSPVSPASALPSAIRVPRRSSRASAITAAST